MSLNPYADELRRLERERRTRHPMTLKRLARYVLIPDEAIVDIAETAIDLALTDGEK
jgi:hypothetical protein